MKDKLFLLAYLIFVVFLSSLSSAKVLLIVSLILVLATAALPIKKKLNTIKRATYVCLLFNFLVSLPYFLAGLWLGQDRSEYLLMMTLRSFSLTLTTFTFFKFINLFKALDFSKNLSFLLVIVSSHLLTYVSLIREFREALKSRTMRKLDRRTRLNFYERVLTFFFERSMHTSEELYQAMKSRGFHD